MEHYQLILNEFEEKNKRINEILGTIVAYFDIDNDVEETQRQRPID